MNGTTNDKSHIQKDTRYYHEARNEIPIIIH